MNTCIEVKDLTKSFNGRVVVEQKLALRSGDMLIFGIAMPVGIMVLINMIAGSKQAGGCLWVFR